MIHHSLSLRLRRSLRAAAALVAVAAVTSSCDSTIYDYEGDCSVTYKMRFRYDHNMKYADAFAHEVKSVTLYAFNAVDGSLAYAKTESGATLATEGYTMTLDGLAPGDYDFVAWGGTEGHDAYILPTLTSRASSRTDAICSLNVKQGDGGSYLDRELNPGLFHGRIAETQTLPDLGEKVMTMPMVKNTNRLTVVLQQLSGEPVKASDFNFRVIGARNAVMGHDNAIISDDEVTYHAWHTRDGVAGIESDGSNGVSAVGAAIADISMGRLITTDNPRLVITRADNGAPVISIPLIDYVLLVKGHYNDMSDQEYLDRQDEYNMTFFIDENHRWVNTHIFINSWKVVLDNVDFN